METTGYFIATEKEEMCVEMKKKIIIMLQFSRKLKLFDCICFIIIIVLLKHSLEV